MSGKSEVTFDSQIASTSEIMNILGFFAGVVKKLVLRDPKISGMTLASYAEAVNERLDQVYSERFVDQQLDQNPDSLFAMTQRFMEVGGQSFGNMVGEDEDMPSHYHELRELRRRLLEEEIDEYLDGEADDDPVQIADGLADVIVIAYGTLLSYFGPELANRVLAEVGRSNLSKFVVKDEELVALKREDGKILKGPEYLGPRIAEILNGDAR